MGLRDGNVKDNVMGPQSLKGGSDRGKEDGWHGDGGEGVSD